MAYVDAMGLTKSTVFHRISTRLACILNIKQMTDTPPQLVCARNIVACNNIPSKYSN